jgi:hypothetical protein
MPRMNGSPRCAPSPCWIAPASDRRTTTDATHQLRGVRLSPTVLSVLATDPHVGLFPPSADDAPLRLGWPEATSNTCYAWFIWDRRGTPAPPGDAGRVGSSGGKVLPRARRAISIGDALHSPRASAMGRSIKGPRVRLSGENGVRLRCSPIMFASGAGGGSRLEAMEANRRCFAARHVAGTSTRPDVDGSPKRSPLEY